MTDYRNISDDAATQYAKKKADREAAGNPLSEREEAILFAQCVELQRLQSPTTAVFPSPAEMTVQGADGRYTVSGFVDAQNANGVPIRTHFTYSVQKTDGQWKCTNPPPDRGTFIQQTVLGALLLSWFLCILGIIITTLFAYMLN